MVDLENVTGSFGWQKPEAPRGLGGSIFTSTTSTPSCILLYLIPAPFTISRHYLTSEIQTLFEAHVTALNVEPIEAPVQTLPIRERSRTSKPPLLTSTR